MVSLQAYCQDEDYEFVGTTPENVNLYIKASTIKVEDSYFKQYKVWVMGYIDKEDLFATQSKLSVKYKNVKLKSTHSEKLLFYIDCQQDKIATCKALFYDKNGEVLQSNNLCEYGVQYDDVTPESIGEFILNYVCNYAKVHLGE